MPGASDADRGDLVRELLARGAAGMLPAAEVVGALQALLGSGERRISAAELAELLDGQALPALAGRVRQLRAAAARAHFDARKGGTAVRAESAAELEGLPLQAPLGWARLVPGDARLARTVSALRDRLLLETRRATAPAVADAVADTWRQALVELARRPSPWSVVQPRAVLDEARGELPHADGEARAKLDAALLAVETRIDAEEARARDAIRAWRPGEALPPDLDESAALAAAVSEREARSDAASRQDLLDLLLTWPTDLAVPAVLEAVREPSDRERAALVLTLRFGKAFGLDWGLWSQWLRGLAQAPDGLRLWPPDGGALELLLVWYAGRSNPSPAVLEPLENACRRTNPVPVEDVVQRWQPFLSARERRSLLGAPGTTGDADRAAVAAAGRGASPAAAAPAAEPAWKRHVRGFVSENAYLVAGAVMVVAGSSLLAYFTWDKHWLLRYTVMPALLAGFTLALARTASWLEARDPDLRGTAATLRAAATALLPANFMALALLLEDPQATLRWLAAPVLAVVYVLLFGRAVADWCRAVDPRLAPWLGRSVIALNGLVLLRPLGSAVRAVDESALGLVLAAGFHLGFVVLAWSALRYLRDALDAEAAAERRTPWFVAAALGVTYLEAFAWVLGSLRHAPEPHVYAAVVVLAGGLVLVAERRFLELGATPGRHAGESFLGYAVILLGVLMAAGEPHMRILTLALAGAIWLVQALPRAEPLHYWIGLVLLALAGASVGLLPGFPRPWLPALGIAVALSVRALGAARPRAGGGLLAGASRELYGAVLVIAAVVAVLTQAHYRSWPPGTALALLVIAALFALKAAREERLPDVHIAAVLVALALPYLGFLDVNGRTFQGNTLAFGLGLLSWTWIALVGMRPRPLLLAARSTVLLLYGAFALGAVALRVLAERGLAVDPQFWRAYPEYLGPLLEAGALVVATYTSRSLVPAAMAAIMAAVLLPGLKADFQAAFPRLAWGTGYGSAWAAVLLSVLALRLRDARALRALPPGDLFLGRDPLPWQRRDHTLFTAPLLATAAYLALKVDTWTFLRQLDHGPPFKTGVALCATAAVWTLFAIVFKDGRWAGAFVHASWVCLLIGIPVAWEALDPDVGGQWEMLLFLAALQGLELLYRARASAHPWLVPLLAQRIRRVIRAFSLLSATGIIGVLLAGEPLRDSYALAAFVSAQLAWGALRERRRFDGSVFWGLAYVVLLAIATPGGAGPLLARLPAGRAYATTLIAALAVQAAHLLFEAWPSRYQQVLPLLRPALAGATLLAAGFGLHALGAPLAGPSVPAAHQALLVVALLVTARAHASGALCLLALLNAYLLLHWRQLEVLPDAAVRVEWLASPVRLALFALAVALLALLPRGSAGGWLAGRFPFRWLDGPARPWLVFPAAAAALYAAFRHGVESALRTDPDQLLAPYIAATALVHVGLSGLVPGAFWLAAAVLGIGNVHAVRLFAGDRLLAAGLSDVHLVALGLGASLLQGTLLRLVLRSATAAGVINRASLAAAALVLALLTANYAAHPSLEVMTPTRFVVSGIMALAAGLYFRRAARRPGPGEEPYAALCEGLYHFGVAVAVWCAALLVPFFRRPATALLALGLPALYFWARAELEGLELSRRYRQSASVLGLVLLGLYALRPVFQMVLFPQTEIWTDHYHYYAPFAMGLGLLLLRLRGLGGTDWLAFYGGVALMTGSYFALTASRGLSPFDAPRAAAWCAIALAHFWTLASDRRSPLQSLLQDLAKLDGPDWLRLRAGWGRFVLAASQGVALLGLLDPRADTHGIAPLLLGASSVLVHHGILYDSRWRHLVAAAQVTLALHADFLVPSYLPRDAVLWALLLIWAALLAAARLRPSLDTPALATPAAVLAALVMAQVLHHHPSSTAGLVGVAALAALALWTPRESAEPTAPEERVAVALLLVVPSWLVFFSQADLVSGPAALQRPWPWLATAAAVFLTGVAARLYRDRGRPAAEARPRLHHQLREALRASAVELHATTLAVASAAAVIVQIVHHGTVFAGPELALHLGLWSGLAVSWWQEGGRRRESLPYVVAELCVVAGLALCRRQLQLTLHAWRYEYDVWVSLAVSFLLAGAKQAFDTRPRELKRPMVATLLILPAAAILWSLWHGLGSDVALTLLGLHSLMFAYMGRDRADSPYNGVAIAGFVAFVLVVFWSKLELRALHAYVVPVGLGVLVLVQLFGRDLPLETRNRVRLVTLLAMLGTASYHALLDERYPVAFNLTLLALCLLAMGLGSWLRIRLYLLLGFTGLLVDLAALLVKALVHMDRGERMTSVGVLVLVLGTALVGGAAYYKAHRDELEGRLDAWRGRLRAWE